MTRSTSVIEPLTDELNFEREAERLHVPTARFSQTIEKLPLPVRFVGAAIGQFVPDLADAFEAEHLNREVRFHE